MIDQNNKYGIIFFASFLPTVAFANAGSPMIIFGMLHLLILNAIIGFAESGILRKYHLENRTWLIVIANYVSMLIGFSYIAPYFSAITGNQDFWGGQTNYGDYELKGFLVGVTTSYLATLIIEFPFFYFAIKEKSKRKNIYIPFLITNSITNLIMIILYFLIVNIGGHW